MNRRVMIILGRGRMGSALRHSLPGDVALRASASPGPRPRRSVAWVLAVTDRALEGVSTSLRAFARPGDVALHLAGARGPEALAPLSEAGVAVASLHPLVAVSSKRRDPSLRGGAFLAEGDAAALREATLLVRELGGALHVATRVRRDAYHGAAALVASGSIALAQGFAALAGPALEPRPSDAWLDAAAASLLQSAGANVRADGARRALASPLLRDDTETVARHLGAMRDAPRVEALYRAVLAQVVEALEAAGSVQPDTLRRARALLDDADSGVA